MASRSQCNARVAQSHSFILTEPFTDDGFTRPLGFSISSSISYIDTLLSVARAADPSAKLYVSSAPASTLTSCSSTYIMIFQLSSSGIDTPGPKLESMISQVQYYKDHSIPIDGVGFRSHFVSGEVPSLANLTANYERLTTLGVEIAITALDIRTSATPSGASILQQQTDYKTVISACKAVAGCVGVTLSDISDKVRSKKFYFNQKYNAGSVFSTPPSPVFAFKFALDSWR